VKCNEPPIRCLFDTFAERCTCNEPQRFVAFRASFSIPWTGSQAVVRPKSDRRAFGTGWPQIRGLSGVPKGGEQKTHTASSWLVELNNRSCRSSYTVIQSDSFEKTTPMIPGSLSWGEIVRHGGRP